MLSSSSIYLSTIYPCICINLLKYQGCKSNFCYEKSVFAFVNEKSSRLKKFPTRRENYTYIMKARIEIKKFNISFIHRLRHSKKKITSIPCGVEGSKTAGSYPNGDHLTLNYPSLNLN